MQWTPKTGHIIGAKTGHIIGAKTGHMADVKTGHMADVKTGCTVDVYAPKGFIKILMTDVERLRVRGVQNFWGLAEIEGARGATEAGAFGP